MVSFFLHRAPGPLECRPLTAFIFLLVLLMTFFCLEITDTIHFTRARDVIPRTLRNPTAVAPRAAIRRPKIVLHNQAARVSEGNSSCVVIGCYSPGTPGTEYFWRFLHRLPYTGLLIEFSHASRAGKRIAPNWCCLPTTFEAQRRYPGARVLYLDIDTWVDVRRWCDVRGLGPHAPIVMNSLTRTNAEVRPDFVVHGAHAQSNAFIVAPGPIGRAAVRRWEAAYYKGNYNNALKDQGAINSREGDICGIPGWIACYSNPNGQKCHCFGKSREVKERCIENLFEDGKDGKCVPHEY